MSYSIYIICYLSNNDVLAYANDLNDNKRYCSRVKRRTTHIQP